MNSEMQNLADDAKKRNIIDMALSFSAMIRLFEKGSKRKIEHQLFEEFQKLDGIKTKEEFIKFHDDFCKWFTSNIKTAKRKRDGRLVKNSENAKYGHAAKLLDVVLKVYVYYSGLPDYDSAEVLMQYMNCAIDNPILYHLKGFFPIEAITGKTVEQIDPNLYVKLQNLIQEEIRLEFSNGIIPTQYDDIMWRQLNRED